MGTGMLHTHKLSVMLFLVLYLFKLIFLLTNNAKAMAAMQKKGWRIFDMGISTLFLATGLYLLFTSAEVKVLQWVKIGMVFLRIPIAVIGFKKGNKPLATLSVLLIFGAYGLAEAAKKNRVAEVAAGATPQETAKAMFVANCVVCHGEDGAAQVAGAANLQISKLSDDEIVNILRNGKNRMPKFSGWNDEQLKLVAAYTKSLRK